MFVCSIEGYVNIKFQLHMEGMQIQGRRRKKKLIKSLLQLTYLQKKRTKLYKN